MSSLKTVSNKSEVANKDQALAINISAGKSIQNLMKSNLGPQGTMKMLISGAGDIRLTKDGKVLLHEMQIQHPTAMMIARTATAQDDMTGDGTTSIVMLVGELLQQAARYVSEGTHPSVLIEGIYDAKKESVKYLKNLSENLKKVINLDKETITKLAQTSLRTKVHKKLADKLADIVVNAINTIHIPNKRIDLHMVELMHMKHKMDVETSFIDGLVLDHGARHPDMKKDMKNCAIFTCNVSLEYEKTEVHSTFKVSSAENRQKLVEAERKVVDDKVKKIIELKNKICDPNKKGAPKNFVIINNKGIDPLSLDLLAKQGIFALRRAKRRNMERMTLACGGLAVNSLEDLSEDCVGYADHVYEQTLGERKYTFVEGTKNGKSCTILIRGPNLHTIAQIKDAIRDGLRSVKNCFDDKCVIPGAGAFEVALSEHLLEFAKTIEGRRQLGVKCFSEALLTIPKTLAQNSGLDPQDSIIKLQTKTRNSKIANVGLDLKTGEAIDPIQEGIFDNYKVKRQFLETSVYTATQLLYVDEILKAGRFKHKTE